MPHLRSAAHLAVFVVLVVVGVGCGGPAATETPVPTLRTPTIPTPRPTFAADDFTELVLAAGGGVEPSRGDLAEKWAAALGTLDIEGMRPYAPPSAVLGYRAGDLPDTRCARGQSAERWRNDARYCPADQRIVFDEDWLRAVAADLGPEAAVAILAHEWGHHVQWLLGRNVEDIREELQADCLSGMYLAASDLTAHGSGEDEVAFLSAAMETWFKLGNEAYDPESWFGAGEHGSPLQRILATATGLLSYQRVDELVAGGMEKGLPFCYGYLDYEIGDRAVIGPYSFVEPPGRPSSTTNGIYLLEPETRTGQPGSSVLMAWIEQLPLVGGATAAQLAEIWRQPAWSGIDVGAAEPTINASSHGGTGVAAPYQFVAADGSNPQTGMFGLVAPAGSDGGLLVLAFQARLASGDAEALAIFEEAIISINQVMNRLCGPDESAHPSAMNLDPVCMDVQ